VNGNHQGVAPQRDFLLAIPAAADQDPATLTEAQTIELRENPPRRTIRRSGA